MFIFYEKIDVVELVSVNQENNVQLCSTIILPCSIIISHSPMITDEFFNCMLFSVGSVEFLVVYGRQLEGQIRKQNALCF